MEFERDRDNSVYHKGYPQCFRLKGPPPNIQVSISSDNRRADFDVDYRSSKFLGAMVNRHLTASNSDVRAGNNDERHNQRWTGLAGWRRKFFGMGPHDVRKSQEVAAQTRPTGKESVDEAVHDFLSSWLVEQKPNQALAYFARQADRCIEDQAARDGLVIGSVKTTNKDLGKLTRIADVAQTIDLSGPHVRPAKNRYPDESRW